MIRLPNSNEVYLIASTRFNTDTLEVNTNYRRTNKIAVAYGSNMLIREQYPLYAITFVVEMNNSTNRIEGIGKILNHACLREWKRIYTSNIVHSEYNTYLYKGKQWISREIMFRKDPELLIIFENILFKKKTHVKRQSGITVITERLLDNWMETKYVQKGMQNLLKRILRLFKKYC